MGLDDCDEAFDDIEARVQLDPRVWARTTENPAPSGTYNSFAMFPHVYCLYLSTAAQTAQVC